MLSTIIFHFFCHHHVASTHLPFLHVTVQALYTVLISTLPCKLYMASFLKLCPSLYCGSFICRPFRRRLKLKLQQRKKQIWDKVVMHFLGNWIRCVSLAFRSQQDFMRFMFLTMKWSEEFLFLIFILSNDDEIYYFLNEFCFWSRLDSIYLSL